MKQTKRGNAVKAERLTITLGEDQRRRIEAVARDARTSVATVIRQAVDRYLADLPSKERTVRAAPR